MSMWVSLYMVPSELIQKICQRQKSRPDFPKPEGCLPSLIPAVIYSSPSRKQRVKYDRWCVETENQFSTLMDKHGQLPELHLEEGFMGIDYIVLGPEFEGTPPLSYILGDIEIVGVFGGDGWPTLCTENQTVELAVGLKEFTPEKIRSRYDRKEIEDAGIYRFGEDDDEKEILWLINKMEELQNFLTRCVEKNCGFYRTM